jgi:hypothetical protein
MGLLYHFYRIRRNAYVRHVTTEANTQGDSGGITNIVGSDYKCYGDKEIYINLCVILSGYRDRADRVCM